MEYNDIANQLTTWFEPSAHKERKLPGGKKWFYVPHQLITQRLNNVCPGHWESKVNQTMISGEFTVIFLELSICGVTRTGVGDSEQPEYNEAGNSKMIGTPAVRAFRTAFKDAAEQHGICGYLDEQTGDKQKFVQYMQKNGDMRAYKNYRDNDWHQTLSDEVKPNTSYKVEETKYTSATKSSNGSSPKKINEKQINRLMAIAKSNNISDDHLKNLIADFGYASKKDITYIYGDPGCDYDRIIAAIENPDTVCQSGTVSTPKSEKATSIAKPPLYPQNNAIISVLIKNLGFKQSRIDAYFLKVYSGMSADMLSSEQIQDLIKKMCRTYAEGNEGAIASIENAVIGKYTMGISLQECLQGWINGYFKN